MARMRGEREQDYGSRRSFQAERTAATRLFNSQVHKPVPCPVACTCNWRPYPHFHPKPGEATR